LRNKSKFNSIYVLVVIFHILLSDIILWNFGTDNLLNIGFDISVSLAIMGFIIFKSKAVISHSNNKMCIKRHLFIRISLFSWATLLMFFISMVFLHIINIHLLHPILAFAGVLASLTLTSTILTRIMKEKNVNV